MIGICAISCSQGQHIIKGEEAKLDEGKRETRETAGLEKMARSQDGMLPRGVSFDDNTGWVGHWVGGSELWRLEGTVLVWPHMVREWLGKSIPASPQSQGVEEGLSDDDDKVTRNLTAILDVIFSARLKARRCMEGLGRAVRVQPRC